MNTRAASASAGLVLVLILAFATDARAAEPSNAPGATATADEALTRQLQELDDRLSATFNAHDIDGLMALFADDVEFFHDKDGLEHFAQTRVGFAGLFAQNNGIRREVVPGSLHVYPLPRYGALEVGTHRFCHQEKGRDDCGTFEFVHVWRHDDAGWKLARVISYGH